MNSIICEGIHTKCKIKFYYEGGTRIVEPFCYGVNSKGDEVLRAYQTDGYSQSDKPYGWRIYIVHKISSISLLNDSFSGNRPYYNPNDRAMVRIYCCI